MGKFNTKPLVNKETTAARLDRNNTLLETLVEDLVHKGITVPLPGDRVCDTKIDTILKKDSNEEKDNNTTKSKDNRINTPTTLEKCINFATIVEESEDGLYF